MDAVKSERKKSMMGVGKKLNYQCINYSISGIPKSISQLFWQVTS